MRTETISNLVLKFQVNRACYHRKKQKIQNHVGKWNKRKKKNNKAFAVTTEHLRFTMQTQNLV